MSGSKALQEMKTGQPGDNTRLSCLVNPTGLFSNQFKDDLKLILSSINSIRYIYVSEPVHFNI